MISKAQNSICSTYCPSWEELQNQSFGSHTCHSPNCQGVEDEGLVKAEICLLGWFLTNTDTIFLTNLCKESSGKGP